VLKNWTHGHGYLLLLIPVASLFFIGGPAATALPVEKYAWNLGHIAFFIVATLAFAHFRPVRSNRDVYIFLAAVFGISIFIEVIQRFTGRDFSSVDILRNLAGAVLTLFFIARKYLKGILIGFFGFVLALDLTGFTYTAVTDYKMQSRAPIVENFESLGTLLYWEGNIEQASENRLAGQFAGKVTLAANVPFPGVNQAPVLADWAGYESVEFNIHNSALHPLSVTIRINDKAHELSDQDYDDRFNRNFELANGWNQIDIPLNDIQQAPTTREMDLTQIYRVGIFSGTLEQPVTLTFDEIKLTK